MSHLIDSFNQHFEVVAADTKKLQEAAYRIRYDVYCVDDPVPDFEPYMFPDQLEHDRYDARSVHSLLRYRPTGEFVGTVRLILHDPSHPDRPFPIEEHGGDYFDTAVIQPGVVPRAQVAEISRMVVKREFRASNSESAHPYFTTEHLERHPEDHRNFRLPLLGILAAILRMSSEHGITHWYAGMEASLHKRLSRTGFKLTPIGPEVNYHGRRRPYFGDITQLMESNYHQHRDVWDLVTDYGSVWPAPGHADSAPAKPLETPGLLVD